jgi:uncharacterized protein involved in exopolysaccharide biosynthesis
MGDLMKPEDSRTAPVAMLHEYEDDVSLADFFGVLHRGWRLIAVVTFLCTAAMTLAAFLITPVYRAEVLLAPVTDEQSGALDKLSGTFGDIAELAGVSLGSSGSSKDEAIALLQSRMLTEQIIREEHLLPVLFAESWDPKSADWLVEDTKDVPTMGDAFKLWDEKIRRVDTSTTSVLVTLTIEWKDRELAARWASELVRRVNELMRTRAIVEAKQSIEYVNSELTKTNVVAVQLAINRIIESQIKTMTLAKVREEYFFKVIDPAVVPDADDYVEPKRLLMIIVGLVGGAMLGLMAVIMKNALRPERRTKPE